ncbi:MAG TPA: Zn-dependent alcohol dehydrogenase [Mycobacteriales bacterium]|nr:Zn-dependent alcohol dehydrogenase [Mycobacteriales bacterium]
MVKASVLMEVGSAQQVGDIALRDLGPGDVRVKIVAAGVCHSDLSLGTGVMGQVVPAVLGHEGSGTVLAVGSDVRHVAPGDHVVLNWAPPCRSCWWCSAGEPWLCQNQFAGDNLPYATLDGVDLVAGIGVGAFAEETVVPGRAVIRLDDDVPLEIAALLGCAVLTGAGAVMNHAKTQPGESVLVVGLGGVGLSALQGARLAGAATIIATDISADKAEIARRCGATEFLVADDDLAKQVRRRTDGRGVDVAIECVGRGSTIRQAWSATRRGGRAVVVGIGRTDDVAEFNALEVFHFARSLSGCVYGSSDPEVDIPRMLEAWRAGRLDLDALVTDRCGLDGIDAAFDRMRAGQGGRTLVLP